MSWWYVYYDNADLLVIVIICDDYTNNYDNYDDYDDDCILW